MTLALQDYWRAIVLYGANTATYKIALAKVLADLSKGGTTQVAMPDVARSFFHEYRKRLEAGQPQQSIPNRKTVLERVVDDFNQGTIDEDQAIARVERQGFNDVIRRFHMVNGAETASKFYDWDGSKITALDDNLFRLFETVESDSLVPELTSRWDLLEVAFSTGLPAGTLDADESHFYRREVVRRRNITSTRVVLNSYQNGLCFYCSDTLTMDTEVDHALPWSALQHDQIWNLVLACKECNRQKRALLPSEKFLAKLHRRNEYYIASNHPIRARLVQQMGVTSGERRAFVRTQYRTAESTKLHVWPGRLVDVPDRDPLKSLGLVRPT